MVSALRILVIAGGLLLTLSFARDARAATVLYRTDAQLVAVSERVVYGRVLDVRVERAPGERGTIYTVARIAVLEDFTGGADPVIEVRELGGTIDGVQMWVPGAPAFAVGQDIVLCLEQAGDAAGGGWRTVAMEFSAFRVDAQGDGDAMLTRDVAASTVIGAPVNDGRSRRLSDFRRVVGEVKGVSPVRPGGEREVEAQEARAAAAAAAGEPVSAPFTLLADMRWRQADTDGIVTWYKNSSAPAPTTAADVDQRIATALQAWTAPTSARLALSYGGARTRADVKCPLQFQGTGFITFEDPNNEVNGSVIAIGGGCNVVGSTHVVNGHTFASMTNGFVIFNNASSLSAGIRSPESFLRVLAHEIGHGIGLGHTCEPSEGIACIPAMQVNLMYPSCCASVMPLPPNIGPDDLAGLEFIYPMPLAPPPPPPDTDFDDDGLPNDWEEAYGLNPNSTAPPNGAGDDPDGDGRTNAQEYAARTHPRGFVQRYFAEGVVNGFFETQFALLNPGSTTAYVLLRLQLQSGGEVPYPIQVPAGARRTVTSATLGSIVAAPFSTLIESDVLVVADRTVSWAGGVGYGSHTETAVVRPATTWYLAEGATGGGFDLYYLLQNSNESAVQVEVTYLRPLGQLPLVKTYSVEAKSRLTIWVDEEDIPGSPSKPLSGTDVSARVRVVSGGPVIVERAMYYSVPGGPVYGAGHESAGVPEVENDPLQDRLEWFFAEGATGSFFDTYILLANPGTSAANVNAQYLLPDGTTYQKTYNVPRESRFTIRLDDEEIPAGSGNRPLQSTAVSTRLVSDVPVIAERSMWWPDGQWYEAHNAAGAQSSGTRWAIAEGENGGARAAQTFLLVANVGDQPANIRVTVMTDTGASIAWPSASTTFAVPARSRYTVSVDGSTFPNLTERFGAVVESTNSQPIVVERSNYYNVGGLLWSSGGAALATKLSTP